MSRVGLILLGLLLSAGPSPAQEPDGAASGVEQPPRVFTPAQERAASEARARQARMKSRRDAGVSLARPTLRSSHTLLEDPRRYHIDHGLTPQKVYAPWLH